jgi:BCCT family betaine/carnitine transporter
MASTDSLTEGLQPSNDWTIFIPALLLVVILGVGLIAFPEQGTRLTSLAMDFVTGQIGWLYLLLGGVALGFAAWLAFGPYGNVLLGPPGEPPEYGELHWIAMMFTAGIGGSMIAWGVAEPLSYLQTPPFGVEPHSAAAMEWAHVYPIFHWGIIPWAFYAIPAVPVSYMLYIHKTPTMKVSGACESALPQAKHPVISRMIDIIIALGIVGGTATSLGLGVPLVSAILAELFGVADDFVNKMAVLVLWTAIFGASAYRGLKKGIKVLADINMVLAVLALLFVLLAGPTLFILKLTVNSVGMLADNFVRMAFWTDPISDSGFPESWTIFYWAWWIAFAPFVGLFLGRISRGRTIRQIILGIIGWGTLGTTTFLSIIGGYAIYLAKTGSLPVQEILAESGMAAVTVQAIGHLPGGPVALVIFLVLCIIFYATTLDSAAYTIASVCSKNLPNDQEPPRLSRVIWAFALALLAVGLIATDQIKIVQASTVVFSLPLLPVLILMCISLVKWLRADFGPNKDLNHE